MEMDTEIIEKRLLTDYKFLIETFMEIRTESHGIQPFIYNPVQRHYWKRRSKRDIILKSRRDGFSTLKLAEGLCLAMTNEGWHSKIVAHTPDAYTELKENQDIMFESLPDEIKPHVSKDNAGVLYFKNLNSKVTVANAGATEVVATRVGRSEQVNFLHLSEFAFYAYPEETYNSLINCVPLETGYASIESTPNGFNRFRDMIIESKKGINSYKFHFYRWFDSPKNMIFDDLDPIEETYTEEERDIVRKYKLLVPQIRWRRAKIKDIGKKKFKQEYPEDFNSCFLRSGSPFFDEDSLLWQQLNCTRRNLKGYKVGIKVFEPPRAGHQYVCGADTAEGIEEGCFDSATFFDRKSGEEVCHIYGKWRPEIFARLIAETGRWYNNAFLGIEKNNHGHAVLLALAEIEKYPKTFIYKEAYDKLGWDTNSVTRVLMFDEYEEALRKKIIRLSDKDSLMEHFTIVHLPNGSIGPQSGTYSDTVIGKMIGYQMLKKKPFTQKGI